MNSEMSAFQILENKCYFFIVYAQNKIRSENMSEQSKKWKYEYTDCFSLHIVNTYYICC